MTTEQKSDSMKEKPESSSAQASVSAENSAESGRTDGEAESAESSGSASASGSVQSQGYAASSTALIQDTGIVTQGSSIPVPAADGQSAEYVSQGFAASSTQRVPDQKVTPVSPVPCGDASVQNAESSAASSDAAASASSGSGTTPGAQKSSGTSDSFAEETTKVGSPNKADQTSPEAKNEGGFWQRLRAGFAAEGVLPAEKYAVGIILLLMGLLPTFEAISRLVLHRGIPGALTYTQHLTLWVGFLGALLATGSGRHLALAIGEFFHGPMKTVSDIYAGILSTAVCGALAYASTVMVSLDAENPKMMPGNIPEWASESIMPIALFIMTARFVWKSAKTHRGRIPAALVFAAALSLSLMQLHASALVTLPFADSSDRSFAVLTWLEEHADALVWPCAIFILLGILLGAPLFIGMSGLAMVLFFGESTPVASVPSETYRLVQNAALPAIPILTGAGYVLAEGGASKRLLRVAKALVGWLPGGLALMVVAVLAGFTTFTGGSGVTILALGGLVLPMLVKEKYPEGFSLGLVTSSGSLGLLFPPSLPVILYSVVAGVGMNDLFIAGLLPGGLLVLLVAAVGVAMGIRCKAPRQSFSLKEAGLALWEAKWELFIPLVVLTAIFTGFATLVEAAALAFLAAILAECIVFKDLDLKKELPETLARAGTLVGAVIILMGVAMGLTSYMVDAEIPALALEWTQAHISSQWAFLLALNAGLLVLGSVLEIYSAIVILAPLLVPMAAAYGIDPIHLGVVFLANLELGFLFPPVGLNLILSATRFGQPLTRLYKVALPFLLIMALGVLLTTYIPAMTTGFLALFK